jgi:poly-gamma-glutamate synthesis protein (capsule biosynthesis protein)
MDWNKGSYCASGTEKQESTFRITIGADWGALWDYTDLMQKDPLAVYGDLLPLFRQSDLNIVNVECALGKKGAPIKKGGPNLRGADGTERALSEVPFHIGCLANNHIMDFGPESLEETINILHSAGVQTVGAGLNGKEAARPLIVQMKNATLGIINCAEGEACASIDGGPGTHPFDVLALQEQIRELKKTVDAVLVIFHGGREYAPVPPPYIIKGLRRLAEAGACAVIAHHPHVPQGVEIHQGVPIAYSQGNFVFRWADTRQSYRYFVSTGYLVHLDFAGKVLSELSLTPYRMKADGVFALQGEEKTQLLRELEQVSALLADERKSRQAWDAFVDNMGQDGMRNLLQNLVNQFDDDPDGAAARLHNIFFCPAHRELYLNGLKRISHGELGDSPQWAKDLVADWANRDLE